MIETTVKCKQCGKFFQGYWNRKYCSKCDSDNNTYHRAYREDNQSYRNYICEYQKMNKKSIKKKYDSWINKNKCPVVYFMINDADEYIYIGSTGTLDYRMCFHLGNGKMKEWLHNYNLSRIEYINVGCIVENKAELQYLERLFIQNNRPVKNSRIPNPCNIDLVRLRELEDYFINGKFDYIKYDYEVWKQREQI